ncbi:MAG TPA: DUF4476 domain-containing protein [Flavobacterium sp.]
MKVKFTLLALFLLTLNFANAQMQPFGHLTIFSEDGDKFTLILNGERINDVPQTNLRVEELTQPYYNAKIVFEDKTKNEISKNYLQVTDADQVFMDVTYKIKRDKNNATKMKLNFFSMIPVVQGYVPPPNVYVTTFGQPRPPVGTVTQTTTTTSSVGGVSAGVHVGGVGVNVSINDPMMTGTTVTQTTHTTSSSSNHQESGYYESTSGGCPNGRPMSQSNFASALQTVKGQSFDDTKLKTAKQIASGNCMTATQIAEMCRLFGFEESKLDFAKFAYGTCTEPANYFKVNNVFTFSTSVDELTEYISGK